MDSTHPEGDRQLLEQEVLTLRAEVHRLRQQLQTEAQSHAQALHQTHDQLQHILSTLEDVVWSWSFQHQGYQYLNMAVKTLYGREVNEFLTNPHLWIEAVHPEDRSLVENAREAMFLTGSRDVEYRILHTSGDVRWVRDRAYLTSQDGTPIRLDGITTDITRRKYLQIFLSNQNSILRMISAGVPLKTLLNSLIETIEAQSIGLIGSILLMDADGQRLRHGAAPHLPDEYNASVDGTPIGANQGSCGTAAWSQQLVVVNDIRSDPRWQAYREMAIAYGLYACWSSPIFSSHGQILGTFALYYRQVRSPSDQDLYLIEIAAQLAQIAIEQHAAEQALQDSEERWQLALRGNKDGIWDWNLKTQQVVFSPRWQQMLGYQAGEIELTLTEWQERIHPEERDRVLHALGEHLDGKTSRYESEYRLCNCDGQYIWVFDRGQAIWDDQGKPTRLVASSTDISHRRHMEEELRSRIQQEQLLGAIAQRIRQSLDLSYVMQTTVEEVRRFLNVDRVLIYRFNPDGSGTITVESLSDAKFSILNVTIHDPCFRITHGDIYRTGYVHAIADLTQAAKPSCYIEMLQEIQVRANLVVPILQRDELWGLLLAHHCTVPRPWSAMEMQLLKQLGIQVGIALQQSQLYEQTQHQAQQSSALSRVIRLIRQSLDLPTIFSTAVSEIGQLLPVDCVQILQHEVNSTRWESVATYITNPDLEGCQGIDWSIWMKEQTESFDLCQTIHVNPVEYCCKRASQTCEILSYLAIPLVAGDRLWGLLALLRPASNQWTEDEKNLALRVADQVAIAIHQSELYQQVQQLNSNLEGLVQHRTAQLEQALNFEALLKRITDRVRDSLDPDQIVQSAVNELGQVFEVNLCNTVLYDLSQEQTNTSYSICGEYGQSAESLKGFVLCEEMYPVVHQQLLRGLSMQFCTELPQWDKRWGSLLLCPMMDEQNAVGNILLIVEVDRGFDSGEIRLVEQVANQCAIAIRQARLYQASQRQVEELERLNHLKDDFLSTVSHELRTPISSIKLASQMLEVTLRRAGLLATTEPTSEPQATAISLNRYLEILQDECDREMHLINDLLDLSRLEAEIDPLLPTEIDLQHWIPHLAEPFLQRTRSRQQSLEILIPESIPTLVSDRIMIERVFTELLNNACKYTPPHHQIRLQAWQEIDRIHLTVGNSGIEIPLEERSRIFDKFYRIPNSDPWKYGGTGLGLALVQRLVERLQGTIMLDEEPGWTLFHIVLPLVLDR
jgi:PAS domain S-box-containing protein